MTLSDCWPHPYSVHPTPDGFMVCGPHAQTVAENEAGGTVSSVYVIANKGRACIVDTGRFDGSFDALDRALKKAGLAVDAVILTHDHYDHVGNAKRLRDRYGCRVLAHALDVPLMADPLLVYDSPAMKNIYGHSLEQAWQDLGITPQALEKAARTTAELYCVPLVVDSAIQEECSLDLAGLEIRLLHTPGHSPGSVSVHVPASDSVYTGDLTFWVNPCRPFPIGNAPACLESLKRVRGLNPAYCGPGHYGGIRQPGAWLHSLIKRHENLEHAILMQLERPKTVPELRKSIFPSDPFDSFAPIPENSIQAWLTALMQQGRAAREQADDTVMWRRC